MTKLEYETPKLREGRPFWRKLFKNWGERLQKKGHDERNQVFVGSLLALRDLIETLPYPERARSFAVAVLTKKI